MLKTNKHDYDSKILALNFNDSINNQDIKSLEKMMTNNHTFINKFNDVQQGKEEMVKSWKKFFVLFPKYRNKINLVFSRENFVVMLGKSEGGMDGPTIWTAYINNNLISEWRVYDDNVKNRKILEISESILEPEV